VLEECLTDFIEMKAVSLIHECHYEFDIETRKCPFATSLVGMGIMRNPICAEILEGLVHKQLLDPQKITYLVHSEVLLKE